MEDPKIIGVLNRMVALERFLASNNHGLCPLRLHRGFITLQPARVPALAGARRPR